MMDWRKKSSREWPRFLVWIFVRSRRVPTSGDEYRMISTSCRSRTSMHSRHQGGQERRSIWIYSPQSSLSRIGRQLVGMWISDSVHKIRIVQSIDACQPHLHFIDQRERDARSTTSSLEGCLKVFSPSLKTRRARVEHPPLVSSFYYWRVVTSI